MAFVEYYGLNHKVVFGDLQEAQLIRAKKYVEDESQQVRVRLWFIPYPDMMISYPELREEADPELGIVCKDFREVDLDNSGPIEWGPEASRTMVLVNVDGSTAPASHRDASAREHVDQMHKYVGSMQQAVRSLQWQIHKMSKNPRLIFAENLEMAALVKQKLQLEYGKDEKKEDAK